MIKNNRLTLFSIAVLLLFMVFAFGSFNLTRTDVEDLGDGLIYTHHVNADGKLSTLREGKQDKYGRPEGKQIEYVSNHAYSSPVGTFFSIRRYSVGNYVNGRRHGSFKVYEYKTEVQQYRKSNLEGKGKHIKTEFYENGKYIGVEYHLTAHADHVQTLARNEIIVYIESSWPWFTDALLYDFDLSEAQLASFIAAVEEIIAAAAPTSEIEFNEAFMGAGVWPTLGS